jgi:hypothetical protein
MSDPHSQAYRDYIINYIIFGKSLDSYKINTNEEIKKKCDELELVNDSRTIMFEQLLASQKNK